VAPFGLFGPPPLAAVAGGLIIVHQLWLIVSGNYSWLNWLTVVLGFSAFGDSTLLVLSQPGLVRPGWYEGLLQVLGVTTLILSVQPTLNLFSRHQHMNVSYNPFHLVNTYGAFGSVTRARQEIILEGTSAEVTSPDSGWLEYDFVAKPGSLKRRPPWVAPYHLRLDWLMWFLGIPVHALPAPGSPKRGSRKYEVWFLRLVEKLLHGDQATIAMLETNPFPVEPPRFIRALCYRYRYTDWQERKDTGQWWKRELIGEYLAPISLKN
jgi:hypothetical protein